MSCICSSTYIHKTLNSIMVYDKKVAVVLDIDGTLIQDIDYPKDVNELFKNISHYEYRIPENLKKTIIKNCKSEEGNYKNSITALDLFQEEKIPVPDVCKITEPLFKKPQLKTTIIPEYLGDNEIPCFGVTKNPFHVIANGTESEYKEYYKSLGLCRIKSDPNPIIDKNKNCIINTIRFI